jgi:IS30 family transposase
MTKYTQLTCEQRYQIKALLKMYLLNIEIANVLGVNKSTINRELQRNRGGRGYRPKRAAESNNRQYPGDYVYNYY